MKKETKIEIFFWLVVVFVFSPRILLEVYENKLKNSLIPFENNEWTVKDKDGNVIYENLTLPYDLRWKEQKTSRREWVFEKEVKTEHLKNKDDLGIVLGRIGDIGYVQFNDCTLGGLGFDLNNKKPSTYSWSQVVYMLVPSKCVLSSYSKIKIVVKKFTGPGFGIYSGVIGFASYSDVNKLINWINFFKYYLISSFGLGLILFVGTQYLFVYLISEKKSVYGIFALLSSSVGMYLLCTSIFFLLPIELINFFEKLLFFSAASSTIWFHKFFNLKFNIFSKKIFIPYVVLVSFLLLVAFASNDPATVYILYEVWHPIFLGSFVVSYLQLRKVKVKYSDNIYLKKYSLAFSIFLLCCLHDVVVSVFGFSNSYLIGYAFSFFVLVVSLTLSREYSDAFEKVEEQVVQRTHELNLALKDVQNIQKLKDDQAKRFAHDIRSPLAALKVLKDIIAPAVPEDQGGLLKHAIVR
ncbi:MAG: 7TM diverse intracellular signaling domain-containing protein, partial [Bdellovibrionota bacterium]